MGKMEEKEDEEKIHSRYNVLTSIFLLEEFIHP
jgi:hypothetical protein